MTGVLVFPDAEWAWIHSVNSSRPEMMRRLPYTSR